LKIEDYVCFQITPIVSVELAWIAVMVVKLPLVFLIRLVSVQKGLIISIISGSLLP